MKITEPDAELREAATQGDLAALDRLLALVQPGIYNLAVRMLGHRDDAADATQEILLKLVTHLASFRGEAAFSTWVWRIARNHLLTAHTRSAESPEVSLEGMAARLQAGLDFVDTVLHATGQPLPMTPQDKLDARQVALGCTQNMLMTLTREQRLAYVLDTVFGLPSQQAAEVVGITPEAYRQRLSRARALCSTPSPARPAGLPTHRPVATASANCRHCDMSGPAGQPRPPRSWHCIAANCRRPNAPSRPSRGWATPPPCSAPTPPTWRPMPCARRSAPCSRRKASSTREPCNEVCARARRASAVLHRR